MNVGLCANCSHVKIVRSKRNSVFYLCLLSEQNAAFAKYPNLPVRECKGYQKTDEAKINPPEISPKP